MKNYSPKNDKDIIIQIKFYPLKVSHKMMKNKLGMYFKHLKSLFQRKLWGRLLFIIVYIPVYAQQPGNELERNFHYQPEGNHFLCVNGKQRFNRALYGTHTAFRVEAGDLPEFALYMPGMGGNMKFGIAMNDSSKWLIDAKKITARYIPGSMVYEVEDPLLENGKMMITVLALAEAEGMILKIQFEKVPATVHLIWAFGGATGKKFSRDGDMGADPESVFYLKPENCSDNVFSIADNLYTLKYGTGVMAEWDPYVNKNVASDTVKAVKIGKEQQLIGFVPATMLLHLSDAQQLHSPLDVYKASRGKSVVITGSMPISNQQPYFFAVQKGDSIKMKSNAQAQQLFAKAELARKKIADRIKVQTPDEYINTLGGALSIAADAIWDAPTYVHGSIAWRMRLNGWRGPYVADVLSWHDRAKMHFSAYALSQVTTPLSGPVIMDTALNLARSLEKMGTSIFSSGYISRNPNGDFRPHHYDMNLVYIDALIRHLYWTGDRNYAKKMWPVITRHLNWEKRNFDPDDDGLYDAYAAIWASDALQYSGGSVTHASAYNYKANKDAAIIAKWIGEDPSPFKAEADKIISAINAVLWMPKMGTYAEFKDLLGNQLLHPQAALWTIYHTLDSEVPDPFQAYQSVKYIDNFIPKIPIKAKGLAEGLFTISTTNWMPYDWSLNNVVMAEVMHTALANWQAGRNDAAFNLFKSELLAGMYLGGSPGNFGNISIYDAARGETYRDFADPVGMTARSLVEGLFGIQPNAISNELIIKPGYPASWDFASFSMPDISIDFKRSGWKEVYTIIPAFEKVMQLKLLVKASGSVLQSVTVNGKKVNWQYVSNAIGTPLIEIKAPVQKKYIIAMQWEGKISTIKHQKAHYVNGSKLDISFEDAVIQKIQDPQKVLQSVQNDGDRLTAVINATKGSYTVFAQLKQYDGLWWYPIDIVVKEALEMKASFNQPKNSLRFHMINNTDTAMEGKLMINDGIVPFEKRIQVQPNGVHIQMSVDPKYVIPGTNTLSFSMNGLEARHQIINWNADHPLPATESIDLSNWFNDKVTNIFKNKYLSPRPNTATLQLPVQGIGDWTHPLKTAVIDDSGLRKLAGETNAIQLPQGIRFSTPSDTLKNNILFTSQWDNYPKKATIPLSGKAAHAYLLMAGSTNPMQSRMVNGAVIVSYTDNTFDTLLLKNPQSWWPIEQDYKEDGYAFTIDAARPVRIHLKTGKIVSILDNSIETYNGKMIAGGAATVLDMPLKANKNLKALTLYTIANDVVIGLMALTLVR